MTRNLGFDLDRVAEHTKLSERQIIDFTAHPNYRVACIGFVPGFTFLAGVTEEFGDAAPRRTAQRNSCRFGLASAVRKTGIYPLRFRAGGT